MKNFKLISQEWVKQQVRTSLITKKEFNTIDENAVDKWCVMLQHKSGRVGVGLDANKKQAIKKAKKEALTS